VYRREKSQPMSSRSVCDHFSNVSFDSHLKFLSFFLLLD
jgi:hypothetical protein